MKIETKYYPIKLGDKTVQVRKWKGKDRNVFKKLLANTNTKPKEILNTMVIECLQDKDVALSPDMLEYLFIKVRELSISDNFDVKWKCANPECNEVNNINLNVNDVFSTSFEGYSEINVQDYKFEIKAPVNAKFYNKAIQDISQDTDVEIVEFALCVSAVNNEIDFTFDELVEFLEELDTETIDQIIYMFNKMKFKIDKIHELTCEKCKQKVKYEFDEIPDFFPQNWLKID